MYCPMLYNTMEGGFALKQHVAVIYMNSGGPTVAICRQSCTADVKQAAQQNNWPLSVNTGMTCC